MKHIFTVLLKTTIVLALAVVLSMHPFGTAKATASPTVYVLGVSNPLDPLVTDLQSLTTSVVILPSVADLTNLGPGSILYIDGSWLATAASLDQTVMSTIVDKVVAGLPTVVVRGDANLLDRSISGLLNFQNPGLPLIAEGTYITGSLADGTRTGALLRVISGFDYSVSAEFQWANQQLATVNTPPPGPLTLATQRNHLPASTIQGSSSAYWQLILNASFDTGDHFTPYGQVQWVIPLYELQNSGSTSYKWINIMSNQTTNPGIQAYNSPWRNYLETTSAHPNDTANTFVSHGPGSQSSSGPFTISYSIGTQAGINGAAVDASQTVSYFLKNAAVTDTSSGTDVSWTHTINGGTSAGKLPFQVVPGFTDRVLQPGNINVTGTSNITFATFSGSSNPTAFQTTGVSFLISGSG